MTFMNRHGAAALALLIPFHAAAETKDTLPKKPVILYAESSAGRGFGWPEKGQLSQYSALVENEKGQVLLCDGLKLTFNDKSRLDKLEVRVTSVDNKNLGPIAADILRLGKVDGNTITYGSCQASNLALPQNVLEELERNQAYRYYLYMDGENFFNGPTTRTGDVRVILMDREEGLIAPAMEMTFVNDTTSPDELYPSLLKAISYKFNDPEKQAKYLETYNALPYKKAGKTTYYRHFQLGLPACEGTQYDSVLQMASSVYVNNHPWSSDIPSHMIMPDIKSISMRDCRFRPDLMPAG